MIQVLKASTISIEHGPWLGLNDVLVSGMSWMEGPRVKMGNAEKYAETLAYLGISGTPLMVLSDGCRAHLLADSRADS